MASGEELSGKHTVIFSRRCLILEDKKKQAELLDEIEKLMPAFDFYITSHEWIPPEHFQILPTG